MYDIMENAKTDLISIIVPVYNTAKYLKRCLDSIVSQTYSNIEIILIDDGSTDESGEICEEYAQRDKRIKVFHQENKGLSAARNIGLDASTGQYISYVDSDDYIADNMCERLVNAILLHHAQVVGCKMTSDNMKLKTCETCGIEKIDKEEIFEYIASRNNWAVMRYLFSACIWENLRFSEGRLYEDALIFPQLSEKISCWIYVPDILYYYNTYNENSITRVDFSIKHLEDALHYLRYWNVYAADKEKGRQEIAFYICGGIIGFVNRGINSAIVDRKQIIDCINGIQEIYNTNYFLARRTLHYKRLPLKAKIRWWLFVKSPYHSQKIMNFLKQNR